MGWEQLGNKTRRKLRKTKYYDTRKGSTNQLHARFLPDSGSGYPGSSPRLPANLFNGLAKALPLDHATPI